MTDIPTISGEFPTIFKDAIRLNRGATGLYDEIPRYFMEGQNQIPSQEPDMRNY
jgi:hypothetical protein